MSKEVRAEILINGFVQGVGFRYFVYRHALALDLVGFCKNLFTGEVLVVVEGERYKIEELIKKLRVGPSNSAVKNCRVDWSEVKHEFKSFEITY